MRTGCAPIYPNIIQDTPVNYGTENSQAAIGVQMAFAYVGSTFLPSIFGALAGVDGYGLLPYFAIGICVLMTVLFGIQKKIVETKVKTTEPQRTRRKACFFLWEQEK